jgi:hypothetical protein
VPRRGYTSPAKPVRMRLSSDYEMDYNKSNFLKIGLQNVLNYCCTAVYSDYNCRKGEKMKQNLMNPMRIRLDRELDEQLTALAGMRGEAKAELCRRLLQKAVAQELAQDTMDPILYAVRQALGDVLKPVEERLAKINAKTAIAAATTMYMNQQVFEDLGKNGRALHEAARKQAVAFVKTSNDQLTDQVGSGGNG